MRSALGALLVLSFGLILFPGAGAAWLALLVFGGIVVHVLLGKGGPGRYLSRLDDLIFAGERTIVCVALVVMAITVFVDVVWRTSLSIHGNARWGFTAAGLVLCMIGGATVRWPGATPLKRIGAGLAAFVVLVLAVLAITAAPNGFGWSQRLALVLLLWVGLLGGSMAAKEGRHIAVDAVRRVVPERFRRGFEIASSLVTFSLAAFLAVLGVIYTRGNWHDWIESEMQAGVFESLPIPYWTATLPIPIGFGLMAVRFLAVAIVGAKEVDLLTSLGATPQSEEQR